MEEENGANIKKGNEIGGKCENQEKRQKKTESKRIKMGWELGSLLNPEFPERGKHRFRKGGGDAYRYLFIFKLQNIVPAIPKLPGR